MNFDWSAGLNLNSLPLNNISEATITGSLYVCGGMQNPNNGKGFDSSGNAFVDGIYGSFANLVNYIADQAQNGGFYFYNGADTTTIRMPSMTGSRTIEVPGQDGTLMTARPSRDATFTRALTNLDDMYLYYKGARASGLCRPGQVVERCLSTSKRRELPSW